MVVDLRWSWMQRRYLVSAGSLLLRNKSGARPDSMGPEQLAALQRPWDRGDTKGRDRCWSLRKMLDAACDRRNLSALRLPWSPLLALRMQMFSDQSPH